MCFYQYAISAAFTNRALCFLSLCRVEKQGSFLLCTVGLWAVIGHELLPRTCWQTEAGSNVPVRWFACTGCPSAVDCVRAFRKLTCWRWTPSFPSVLQSSTGSSPVPDLLTLISLHTVSISSQIAPASFPAVLQHKRYAVRKRELGDELVDVLLLFSLSSWRGEKTCKCYLTAADKGRGLLTSRPRCAM